MRRLLVTNEDGDILATGPHPDDGKETAGEKTKFGFFPLDGQYVHEVDLPLEIKTVEQVLALHRTYRVRRDAERATLVAR